MPDEKLHILVLTDRDWTHPQGGGTGANLYAQVSRWLAWGHQVTVVACGYPGASREEEIGGARMIRVGGRSTVFPRVILRGFRGHFRDADVVLEVVNGVTFMSPLWLSSPRAVLVHHVHREHYVREMGRKGRLAAWLLETLPLRLLYSGARFLTVSRGTADELRELGAQRIDLAPNGVQHEVFGPGEKTPAPTLLYLGRIKRYKRIETLLDVLEGLPGDARLEIAGDGDHRKRLAREIRRRGLGERVTLHGSVSEEHKRELYRGAWVNVTASAAEGWCLSVTEAAACGTPTAALRVGGLPDAVLEGETGVLAEDGEELLEKVRELLEDRPLRERMGEAALERARGLDWDHTALTTLNALRSERDHDAEPTTALQSASRSDTGKAAGLAIAQLAANVMALLFTIVFARILGEDGYGSLAALLSFFLILSVPGSAMQVLVAREVSGRVASGDLAPAHGMHRWLAHVTGGTVVATLAAVLLRQPLANVIGIPDLPWAAALTIPAAGMWLLASIERGALQGLRRYKLVGWSVIAEATGRLAFGLAFVAGGLDVTGSFAGTGAALLAVSVFLFFPLEHELRAEPDTSQPDRRLRDLLLTGLISVLALGLIQLLQNLDVLIVKHEAIDAAASAYAAAAVAAKAVIWISVGLGWYLLPEAARRTKLGEDARPILVRSLGLVAIVAVPMTLVYAVAARPLLDAVFKLPGAAGALPWLALAMTALSSTYLVVQYLLALRRWPFLLLLAAGALAEVLLLPGAADDLTEFALILFVIQGVLAVAVGLVGFRWAGARTPMEGDPEAFQDAEVEVPA